MVLVTSQLVVERNIRVRFKLRDPVLIKDGRWINRGRNGYYLPWLVKEIEVTGRLATSQTLIGEPVYNVRGYGHTITKAGRQGAPWDSVFHGRGYGPELPPEFAALRDQVVDMATTPHAWPVLDSEGR